MSHRDLEVVISASLPSCSAIQVFTLPTWATLSAGHSCYTSLKFPTDSVSDAACNCEDPSARNKKRMCFSSLWTAGPTTCFLPSWVLKPVPS